MWQENPEFFLPMFLDVHVWDILRVIACTKIPVVFSRLSKPVFLLLFQEVVALKNHIKLAHCVSCTSCFIGG